jgi:hypothetical protein
VKIMSDDTSPTISADAQATLETVCGMLSTRKRRLGHYSVQWKDNAPFIEGDDAPEYLRAEQKIP